MYLRPLLFLAFIGLLTLPDWSTARPFRRFASARASYPAPVVYSYPRAVYYPPAAPVRTVPVVFTPVASPAPVAYSSAPVVYPQSVACPPVYAPPVTYLPTTPAPKGPRVIPERMPEPKPVPPAATRAEPKEIELSPIRPASAEERSQPVPGPMPIPIPSVPPRPFGEPIQRSSAVDFAPPKAAGEEAQKPPVKPLPLPEFPPLGLDKPAELPKAVDPIKVAPAKPTESKSDPLPTFELPPLPPLAPAQPISSEKPTVAKSSPLNADAVAEVYPTAGSLTDRDAKRSVGFINKSNRDIVLTVEGKTTTLPRGQYLQLDLPAKFAWQIGGEKEREVTVPDAAPGVSVVIRR